MTFVSRAGQKLDHALASFRLDVRGALCADLGCNVGGFTDCLLQRGAASVHAVDTAYGLLDWRLRNDPRVVVRERTNALHAAPPPGGVDLVVIDLGWTPQRHAIPAALRWLRDSPLDERQPRIVSLIKPHYERPRPGRGREVEGGLADAEADLILAEALAAMPALGVTVLGMVESPVRGGKSSRHGPGNREFIALLRQSQNR